MWAQSTDPADGCHRTGVRASFDTATDPKLPPCAPLTPRPPISCLQLACATGALRLQLLLCLLHRPILLRRNLAQLVACCELADPTATSSICRILPRAGPARPLAHRRGGHRATILGEAQGGFYVVHFYVKGRYTSLMCTGLDCDVRLGYRS